MRKLLVGTIAALVLAVPASSAVTATVKITRTAFSPSSVTIESGGTVTWRNSDTIRHQVVANNGSFVSPILRPGQTYTHRFRQAGRFDYHDALKPALKGVVRVTGPPPSVTLGTSLPMIRYGTEIMLSGAISTGRAGERVAIYAQPYPQTSFVQLAVVQTTTGGRFDFVTKPQIYTNYKAQWRSTASGTILVQVAPRITLSPPRRGWFHTQVTAARSFAGRSVYVQRLSRFGQWVSIRKLKLGRRSGRTFRLGNLPRGRSTLRVFMTVNQAGAGYLAGRSGTQPVRVRR
ncbi:MAG: cupredoxin domain-containing protein [Actinomycetota bacterium]|nr:cupredoxin domain-containing protein [Actinomycetota bacterium]